MSESNGNGKAVGRAERVSDRDREAFQRRLWGAPLPEIAKDLGFKNAREVEKAWRRAFVYEIAPQLGEKREVAVQRLEAILTAFHGMLEQESSGRLKVFILKEMRETIMSISRLYGLEMLRVDQTISHTLDVSVVREIIRDPEARRALDQVAARLEIVKGDDAGTAQS